MSDPVLDGAVAMLSGRLGFRLDGSSRGRLRRALKAGVEDSGQAPALYLRRLEEDPSELQLLLDRLTVQETSFFRDPGHFQAFARHVLPTLPDPVRVWCAGCANGQEPYSVAMLLDEAGRTGWRITATDISTTALQRTRDATYTRRELKGLSEERRALHLVESGGRFMVRPELRAGVEVKAHNLVLDPLPFSRGACGLVFCRNVLIYLEQDVTHAFLVRLHDQLPAGAHLFLGASESLWGINDSFGLVRLGGTFVYRRPADGEARRREATSPAVERRAKPVPPLMEVERRKPTRSPTRAGPAAKLPETGDLLSAGEASAARGEHAEAARAFRQVAYLDDDQVLAHAMLGMSLDALGEEAGARRAFRAARSALARVAPEVVEAQLGGYRVDELVVLLDGHLKGAS